MKYNTQKFMYGIAFAFIAFVFLGSPLKVAFAGTAFNLFDSPTLPSIDYVGTCMFAYSSTDSGQDLNGVNSPFTGTGFISSVGSACSGVVWSTYLNAFATSHADGTYTIQYGINATHPFVVTWYDSFTVIGGEIYNPEESTILSLLSPSDMSSITTPFNVTGFYKNLDTYDTIRIDIFNSLEEQTQYNISVGAISTNSAPYATQIQLPFDSYTMDVYLYDTANSIADDDVFSIEFEVAGFNPILDPATECSLTEIASCLQVFITWAFVPSSETLEQFSNLTLENSAPFSYLYDIQNVWDELLNTAQTETLDLEVTTGIGNITFISEDMLNDIPLSSTIRTILGYLLYLMTAFTIFRILKSQVF